MSIEKSSYKRKVKMVNITKDFGKESQTVFPNCKLLDLRNSITPNTITRQIKFEFWNTKNVSFNIRIVERNMALLRRRQDSFAYNGPYLGVENLYEKKKIIHIGLNLRQNLYSDSDKGQENICINYPSKNFKSFRECDEKFVIEEMQKKYFMPFWATDDTRSVTSSK